MYFELENVKIFEIIGSLKCGFDISFKFDLDLGFVIELDVDCIDDIKIKKRKMRGKVKVVRKGKIFIVNIFKIVRR